MNAKSKMEQYVSVYAQKGSSMDGTIGVHSFLAPVSLSSIFVCDFIYLQVGDGYYKSRAKNRAKDIVFVQ